MFSSIFLDVRKEEDQQKGQGSTREEKGRKMWIRKEPDPDGYFLLQFVNDYKDMFLTAKDASSLTVAGK